MNPTHPARTDETGSSSVLAAAIVLPAMLLCTFAAFQIAMVSFSAASIHMQVQDAITDADIAAVAVAGDASEALRQEILNGSHGLDPDSLNVTDCVVDTHVSEDSAPVRTSEGVRVETISREETIAHVTAKVSYRVPSTIGWLGLDKIVLEQNVDSYATVSNKTEVG